MVVSCASHSKRTIAQNIDDVSVVRQTLGESNYHFAIGIAKADEVRNDRHIVAGDQSQR